MLPRSAYAAPDERTRGLPGDAVIRRPVATTTHAVTVHATPDDIWPWLARTPAPLAAGMVIRDLLDGAGAAEVITFEPLRFLVLGRRAGGAQEMTWALVLTPQAEGGTRLVIRTRSRHDIAAVQRWRQRRALRRLARCAEAHDALLERFLPACDARHHHAAHVAAPANRTMAVAMAQDFMEPRLIRAVVGMRAWMLGARTATRHESRGLVADMEALGWAVLEDVPGHEIVMGAATRPWDPSPRFLPLPGHDFVRFHEPGYVKIAWSVRVEPDGLHGSFIHTETRALATDAGARRRFVAYWRFVSRGTELIRHALLTSIRREAERPILTYRRAS
jgi:hypothetical protein